MRAVVSRVAWARVVADGELTGEIGPGLLVLVGVTHADTQDDAAWLAAKVAGLRVFDDDQGKMNRSLAETGGGVLVVSQFTLYGDARNGRRPSYLAAPPPERAPPPAPAVGPPPAPPPRGAGPPPGSGPWPSPSPGPGSGGPAPASAPTCGSSRPATGRS